MANETKETLLDAISAAVASHGETPAADTSTETTTEGTENETESTAETGGEGGGEENSGEGSEADGAAGDGAAGEADGADGETDEGANAGAVSGTTPAAGKPGEKPAAGAEAAAKPPAKAPDPLNDPIPSGVAERTGERIKSLIDMVKTRDGQIGKLDEIFTAIESTGMKPEEFSTMLGYARAIHGEDPVQLNAAYEFLQGELRGLALRLGKSDGPIDFLRDHADLQEAVEAGQVTEKHAREMALLRTQTAETTRRATERTNAQNEHQARVTAHTNGVNALNALGAELAAKDGALYQVKAPIVTEMVKEVLAGLPPDKWAAAWRTAYAKLKMPAPSTTGATAANPKAKTQPLRTQTPAGGQSKQPTSMKDAVFGAIEALTDR